MIGSFASTFARSHKGNLWRRLDDGTTLSVFLRWERYSWCIRTPEGETEYGARYDTEAEAMDGLEIACADRFAV